VNSTLGYRLLTGIVGIGFTALGLFFFAGFFGYQQPGSTPAVPTGPMGYYFIAFTGCALVAWGGALINGARRPESAGILATPTAIGLTMMAIYRMVAWVVGDYHMLGNLPRFEAGLFLLLALAFVWLRPGPSLETA